MNIEFSLYRIKIKLALIHTQRINTNSSIYYLCKFLVCRTNSGYVIRMHEFIHSNRYKILRLAMYFGLSFHPTFAFI